MKTKLFLGAILTVILVGGNIFAAGRAKPKVTMEEAQTTALKRIPGEVESSETKGKDYSFEILGTDGIKRNVLVGEKSGKIKRIVVR